MSTFPESRHSDERRHSQPNQNPVLLLELESHVLQNLKVTARMGS